MREYCAKCGSVGDHDCHSITPTPEQTVENEWNAAPKLDATQNEVKGMEKEAGVLCDCQNVDAVMWNEFNRVVQCHRCGTVYKDFSIEALRHRDADNERQLAILTSEVDRLSKLVERYKIRLQTVRAMDVYLVPLDANKDLAFMAEFFRTKLADAIRHASVEALEEYESDVATALAKRKTDPQDKAPEPST